MLVATHNLMHGLRLGALIERYQALHQAAGLDLLCVQENERADGVAHTERIAAALGPSFEQVSAPARNGVGVVYDRACFEVVDSELVELPKLTSLSWLERRYIAGGKPEQKHALRVVFRTAAGASVALVGFHLDTAGGNRHRRGQVAAIAESLATCRPARSTVVCGDTNAFTWRNRRHPDALRDLLSPLAERGLVDVAARTRARARPTHFFARQRESALTHRLTVLAGKLGLDAPRRYDVICSNLSPLEHGVVSVPESDHDIVWAALSAS